MKAQFVYENLQFLNEDQKSFDDLARLSKEIFNHFYEKYGPSKALLDELDRDWNKIFDHIIPLSKGVYITDHKNIQILCGKHNLNKSNKIK